MADFIIGGQVNIDGGNAEKSVGSIKQQLRDAQKELIAMSDKFGATSREAVNAAKKVGEFKDKIGDAKTLSDAFNPDAKFKGFANALQGVVGGFAALQGAQALFGSESEDLQKVLVKVQGAMALSQGINSVLESRDAFKALGAQLMQFTIVQKIVTAAQKLWNAAMKANPIGALVVAITLLISGIAALVTWLSSSAKAAKAQEAAVKEQTKAIESQNKTLERNNTLFEKSQSQQLALAKAQGQSAEAIRALEIKLADEKIAYEKSSAAIAKNTMDKQRNLYETLKASGASDDVIKKQLENLNKSIEGYNNENKNIEKALINKKDIENRHLVEIESERTNARKEESTNNKNHKKELLDKEKKHNEDIANANKSLQQQLKALREENYLSTIKDESKKAEAKLILDYENEAKVIKQSIANEELKQQALAQLDIKYTNLKQAIIDERALKDKEAKDKQTQIENDAMLAQIDAELAFTDELIKLDDERVANEKKNAEERIKAKQAETEAKIQLENSYLDAVSGGISIIKMFSEQNKGLQKAALIAENAIGIAKVVIAANQSVLETRAKANAIPAFIGPGVPNPAFIAAQAVAAKNILSTKINAGISIATMIAATAKGLAGIGAGGGGGTGGGNIGGGGGGGTQAPIQAQLQTTTLNQSQIQQMGNAAVRSFVVESDVSGNQERIRRLNRAARIN
jgi:hypothetical protein